MDDNLRLEINEGADLTETHTRCHGSCLTSRRHCSNVNWLPSVSVHVTHLRVLFTVCTVWAVRHKKQILHWNKFTTESKDALNVELDVI